MRESHPIRPENLPTEYLYHLGHATRELDDFFSGLYPARRTDEPRGVPHE